MGTKPLPLQSECKILVKQLATQTWEDRDMTDEKAHRIDRTKSMVTRDERLFPSLHLSLCDIQSNRHYDRLYWSLHYKGSIMGKTLDSRIAPKAQLQTKIPLPQYWGWFATETKRGAEDSDSHEAPSLHALVIGSAVPTEQWKLIPLPREPTLPKWNQKKIYESSHANTPTFEKRLCRYGFLSDVDLTKRWAIINHLDQHYHLR